MKLLRRRAAPATPPGSAERLAVAAAAERHLLRNRGLAGVLAREIVSLTGSQMTWVALPWFVLTTSGSPTRMTIVLAVEAVAVAIGGLGGSLATRLGPRRTMLIADGLRAPVMAAIPILHVADALTFPILLALVFAVGLFATPSYASKTALLPDLVGEDEVALGKANALLQTANRLTSILGPPLAGVLIGVFGATEVLLIDAATFVVGFALVAALVPSTPGHEEAEREDRGMRAVLRFIGRDPLLRPWTAAFVIGDVAWLALFAATPVLVLDRFGEEPEIVGWIFAGFGIGAVVGNVVAFRILGSVDRLLLASVGELGMALPLWLFLLHVPPAVLVAAMAAAGFANGLVNAPLHAILQLRTPRHLRTGFYSLAITATMVLGPVALVGTGPALEYVGVDPTLALIVGVDTLAVLAFTAAGLRFRASKQVLVSA
jgi:MFS family permease